MSATDAGGIAALATWDEDGCLRDLGAGVLAEIERLLVFHDAQKGVRFEVAGRAGKSAARRLVDAGQRKAVRGSVA